LVLDGSLVDSGPTVRLEHVLLHELAHVRRRDNWLILAAQAVQIVFWFHPGAWIARRRLGAWIEICCDRRATMLADRGEYRRTLLAMARVMFVPRMHDGLAFFARRGELLARIKWLSAAPASFSLGGRAATALACATALSLPNVDCSTRDLNRALAAVERAPTAVSALSAASAPAMIDDFDGCLRRRYFVLAKLAAREGESLRSIP
jgi:beta-lactamase regulating signal transducer with metallopeptidase domain